MDLEPAAAGGVAHAEAVDGGGVVVADFLFFGIEADALADDDGLVVVVGGACVAPHSKGHLEADGEDAFALEARGAGAEGVAFAGGLVRGEDAFFVRRDVPPHVEALHFGGCGDAMVLAVEDGFDGEGEKGGGGDGQASSETSVRAAYVKAVPENWSSRELYDLNISPVSNDERTALQGARHLAWTNYFEDLHNTEQCFWRAYDTIP